VAEELVLEHMTTGAGNDIEKATDLARRMVCEWGMSEKLGPMTFGKKEEEKRFYAESRLFQGHGH
jgi:cell division protease FtsH